LSLREFLVASGESTEHPDRHADCHARKDDLGDQEEETCRDPNEREEKNQEDFPQQDSDYTRGGDAENGLQNGQAPVEAATLRQFGVKGVKSDRNLGGREGGTPQSTPFMRRLAAVERQYQDGPNRSGFRVRQLGVVQ